MDIITFAQTVEMMRNSQKAYFRDRKPSDLNNSKFYERIVDDTIKEILHPGDDRQTALEL